MKAVVKQPCSVSLKYRLYRSLCSHGIAILSTDLCEPSTLEVCLGHQIPTTGIELLSLLIELAREGKMVIWQDDGTVGFLPTRIWERELADINNLPRLTWEVKSLRLDSNNGVLGIVLSLVLARLLKNGKRQKIALFPS